jgi:hypothetical protein
MMWQSPVLAGASSHVTQIRQSLATCYYAPEPLKFPALPIDGPWGPKAQTERYDWLLMALVRQMR